MLRVGLTGGLASGKSFVARELAALGCMVIHADELGHQALDEEARESVLAEFGPEILNPDGTVNRRELGERVFNDPERLQKLNAMVHPAVRARTARLLDEFARREPHGIAIVEAAILIETGSYKNYDRLIVAFCDEEQQIERAMSRDGLTREQVLDRLRRQMPLADKMKYADYVVDTSGAKQHSIEQTRAVFESLRSLSQCD